MEVHADIADQYVDFADSADGSPCFEEWARAVPDDPEVCAWLERLPVPKRQPNLVFAAARWHGVPAPGPYDGLRRALLEDDGRIRRTILERATQTNEVGRLATLVPVLATLVGAGPVALLEVGASAGLCLYPDRWDYEWECDGVVVRADTGQGRVLRCRVTGPAPLPDRPPEVAWRGGIDLNPLDVTDTDQMAWLEMLVWPEDDDRRARLARAVEVARADPPYLVRGDLLEELPSLVERASAHGPVVVFHSAVVAYLTDERREAFRELMTGLVGEGRCRWVSNEGPRVLPSVTATLDRPVPGGPFVIGVDGRAVAVAHGHGRSLDWSAGAG